MNILITGGAGYIGSHACRQLVGAGHNVVVVDNLSHGYRQAVDPKVTFYQASIDDQKCIETILKTHQIEAVLHFAAFIEVGESVAKPSMYYHNNLVGGLALLEAMMRCGVMKIVFSSTAAVYGNPETSPILETSIRLPVNPYGHSKNMMEHVLADYAKAYGLGYAAMRYFNVAGASPEGGIGEAHEPESHLIPRILTAAMQGGTVGIYGIDYPTPDGTCIRDYIHVDDLVAAHILALHALEPGKQPRIYNLGSESGFSVREVIEACRKVTGKEINIAVSERRPGDPAMLVASSAKIRSELGWTLKYPELKTIIAHAWAWHLEHFSETDSASSRWPRAAVVAEAVELR